MTDAHRALELLEDYHSRLTKPQDRPLRNAIERVIRIFKSRLFQALLGKNFLRTVIFRLNIIFFVVLSDQLSSEGLCLVSVFDNLSLLNI